MAITTEVTCSCGHDLTEHKESWEGVGTPIVDLEIRVQKASWPCTLCKCRGFIHEGLDRFGAFLRGMR